MRKGYTGEGFLSEGKKLGGNPARLPMHEARRRATAAAEKRKLVTAGSGQKLGGRPVGRGTDIRSVIADAAQRRVTVTKGCASGTNRGRKIAKDVEENRNGFRTKADEDDANERAIMQAYIDLIQEDEKEKYGNGYLPPSESNPAGPRATLSPPPPPTTTTQPPSIRPSEERGVREERPVPVVDLTTDTDPDTWTCEVCTLVNPNQFLACDACTTDRPTTSSHLPGAESSVKAKRSEDREKPNALKPRQSVVKSLAALEAQEALKPAKPLGWLCHVCNNWMESQWWTCAKCGNMKQAS